ncbi:hypothetical protein D6779_04220 [Candidatus Parcubacteria bacterium]|nr:MAG: hypothetical protein D6779_04220 [Candidatus Parcubacteria bacterium]
MKRQIEDEDVKLLATIAGALQTDYAEDDLRWAGSPFAWIITRPSRTIGAIGEKLVAGWCAAKGLDVIGAPNTDCDRVINGKRVEIKFSRLWKTDLYKFQQLRDQDYDFAICLGISPFDAHCWVLSKRLILEKWGQPDGLPHQHGGAAGSDTVWLSVRPDAVQPWLKPCGGRLRQAFELIKSW